MAVPVFSDTGDHHTWHPSAPAAPPAVDLFREPPAGQDLEGADGRADETVTFPTARNTATP